MVIGDRLVLAEQVEKLKQRGKLEPRAVSIPTVSATSGAVVETITKQCAECDEEFQVEQITIGGKPMFTPKRCATCFFVNQETVQGEVVSEETIRRDQAWLDLCPPLYRGTDPAKLTVSTRIREEVGAWQVNPKGIGLAGGSGAGKTRLMFLLLRRLHFSGTRCRAITAKRFESWCHKMFDKDDSARVNIEGTHNTPVLFIDDIGKEKYTERVESEFYDLIEHRTSHLLPILWTANASGEQLVRMMGEDRGAPIVRRLREFSTVISV